MSRPSRPWLLPVVCTVLGVAWVLWLAHETRTRWRAISNIGAGHRNRRRRSSRRAIGFNPRGLPSGSPCRPPSLLPVRAPRTRCARRSPSACNLCFRRPPARRIGESFDVRVAIDCEPADRPHRLSKSPTTLRCSRREPWKKSTMRSARTGERAFKIDEINDGRVTLVDGDERRGEILPVNVPLVQFEALSPGWAQIRIDEHQCLRRVGSPRDLVRLRAGKAGCLSIERTGRFQAKQRVIGSIIPFGRRRDIRTSFYLSKDLTHD